MFHNTYPLFERKRLLKKEMLENIRDYPRDLFQIFYQGYSDGILLGCTLHVKGNDICVEPGVLYYKDIPYIMENECQIPYKATGTLQYMKVRFLEYIEGIEKKEFLTQMYIDEEPVQEKDEIELARFKLQEGARLRDSYTDYFDYHTEFDTIIRIYVPYASLDRKTVCPEITRAYAETMMQYPITNPWDCAFCLNCLQGNQPMSYGEIKAYLNLRLQKERDYAPAEIYHAFSKLILESKGQGTNPKNEPGNDRKMLLL